MTNEEPDGPRLIGTIVDEVMDAMRRRRSDSATPLPLVITHPPGSEDALAQGCSCPIAANHHRDFGEGVFAVHDGCLVHGWLEDPAYSVRIRNAAGEWWLDEETNPQCVFACSRSTDYYIPMTESLTDEHVERWLRHLSMKRWCHRVDDLAHILALGRKLQLTRIHDPKKTPSRLKRDRGVAEKEEEKRKEDR